jgi:hypothetical protein
VSVIIEFGRRTRGRVSGPMVAWAVAMAAALFLLEARVATGAAWLVGLGSSVALGAYLGWRRRAAAVLVAPLVSWMVAWPALWVAAMIHHGVVKGFFIGLALVTVAWVVIGPIEIVGVGLVAVAVRALRGGPDVIVLGPDGRRVD